jgi:glycosyltransferase involved in cell wall biosynthesis
MRILLVGEYSNFHNSLKHGLQSLGHEVTLVGDRDGFKDLPVDIYVGSDYYQRNWFREKFKVAWWKLTGRNLEDRLRLARFRESEHLLKDFDIVQFINSNPLGCEPAVERKMLEYLVNNNGKAFLVACGDDVPYVDYLVNRHDGYSILDAVEKDKQLESMLWHTYKYLGKDYRSNYNWLVSQCEAIIPSHVDFAMGLTDTESVTGIIPVPVITSRIALEINKNLEPIEIFMGINRGNYYKKGINYFEQALTILKDKYQDKVRITIAENLPYKDYIQQFKNAHILLDQVLSYDQGYNALEAMLQGKVVFSGGGDKYLNAHKLESVPMIDARPDVDYLVQQLAHFINQPSTIEQIGEAARKHVLSHHDALSIAKRYQDIFKHRLSNV